MAAALSPQIQGQLRRDPERAPRPARCHPGEEPFGHRCPDGETPAGDPGPAGSRGSRGAKAKGIGRAACQTRDVIHRSEPAVT